MSKLEKHRLDDIELWNGDVKIYEADVVDPIITEALGLTKHCNAYPGYADPGLAKWIIEMLEKAQAFEKNYDEAPPSPTTKETL